MEIKRRFVYKVKLDPAEGHEMKKSRPCLVISSINFNDKMGLATIVPITDIYGTVRKHEVRVYKTDGCIPKDSKIIPHQIRTLSTDRFIKEYGELPTDKFAQVLELIRDHLNL